MLQNRVALLGKGRTCGATAYSVPANSKVRLSLIFSESIYADARKEAARSPVGCRPATCGRSAGALRPPATLLFHPKSPQRCARTNPVTTVPACPDSAQPEFALVSRIRSSRYRRFIVGCETRLVLAGGSMASRHLPALELSETERAELRSLLGDKREELKNRSNFIVFSKRCYLCTRKVGAHLSRRE